MATRTEVTLTCDLCGSSDDVQTQSIGFDGKTYEVDLCQKDQDGLIRAAQDYIGKARKVSARKKKPETSRPERETKKTTPNRPAKAADPQRGEAKTAGAQQDKGILVYGILPDDIEVADETPGVGEDAGPLRVVRSDGLAALVSEVEPSGRLGTPDDLSTYREILDVTATEAPVVPLSFGTVLASEDAVTDELLAPRHDEFADALEEFEGRVEFMVKGRYVDHAAGPGRADAARALAEAMQEHCVASVAPDTNDERDEVQVAFLVDADQEGDVERVIEKLAQEWEGRIELELLGPTAPYDFVEPGKPGKPQG